jgi:hypothetical protein
MKSVGKIVRYQLAGGVAVIEARRVGDRFCALALHEVEHLMDVLHIDAFAVKARPKVGKFFAFGRRRFGLVCHLVILLWASRGRSPKPVGSALALRRGLFLLDKAIYKRQAEFAQVFSDRAIQKRQHGL